ncbi:MAG: hypothetical protein RI563_12935 [Thiohalophilus sp.]|uniref:DUF4124 domain-containing protein n=1 Tax=Thiohalophilus sp. TaxID=3028392 RepID=UPI002870262B|nr:DUF4124 domain-containing protein [Thiohalophilus sp.]MDR9437780.1 hypothetical protein [Thiohalophilus sp.]
MNKATAGLLIIVGLIPISGHTAYVCTDDNGNTSFQDRPCPEKNPSITNVPIKANELSDRNSIETVSRFYKAMSERDPIAASRFLADTFSSEVRRRDERTVKDDKMSLTAALHQILSAAKEYNAKINCNIVNRTSSAYSLSCHVDEQGIVMNQFHRTVSDQAVTIVLDSGFVKIRRIISDQHE